MSWVIDHTEKKRENGIENIGALHIVHGYGLFCKTSTSFVVYISFIWHWYKGYFCDLLLWAVLEIFESHCCNLYSYFMLVCINGAEQQKLLGGKKVGFFWSLLLVVRVRTQNLSSPYALLRSHPPRVGETCRRQTISPVPLPLLCCNSFKMGRSGWGDLVRFCLVLSNLGT